MRTAWSHVDFVLRLIFFAAAPFAIVLVAALFPVRGALIDVALALLVFAVAERARRWAARWRILNWAFDEALAFESFYRTRDPRPFLYYLFYPLLFPYWLIQRDARREFLVFRGYNLGGVFVLLATLVWQYFARFTPELGWREFLPQVWLTLLIEMLLALPRRVATKRWGPRSTNRPTADDRARHALPENRAYKYDYFFDN